MVPNTDLEFFLNVHLADAAVVKDGEKHLAREYDVPLPASVVANQFDDPQIVMEGGKRQTMGISHQRAQQLVSA
ncbi:hypothetical protein [Bifidobacterium pseudolongum]|uniref:Uncharacterized protein n=1 Tax=Bifidobacterium pseudolongum subsp. pseudolongum TaxID=31954 RepID=A0A4Q5ABJ0_9BIFI|nr:hypothetical protein [Bifidobacterium pseudolongum]KFI78094.1 hypothetical protein BPSP_1377 [Bifidobacterium pseudolongum subsp. pseudolongum]MDY3689842.1 hypothetical protein [Bifidobacterium pseudolongum]PKV00328.1 hypothetical protein CQR52_0891 [Bifidobacterium pseudolongum subsp. pseudolongum]PKV08696.1 hypothetical protein CQR49_0251 [Bifidobacterium pseudolongum subsp. pseudolongum]RYQ21771.1 hypothetical protein PG2054B_0253 [Bifidobacterium pseudolongum subsp. pseudolongum]